MQLSYYGDSCIDTFVGQLVNDLKIYSDGVKAKHSTNLAAILP